MNTPAPLTDEQAEMIVVTANLYGCSELEAAHRLGLFQLGLPSDYLNTSLRARNGVWSWEATLKIMEARVRLKKNIAHLE